MQKRLTNNVEAVRSRIASAAAERGRDPGAIELVAVTKSVPPPLAAALVEVGQTALGENRVDELERKADWLARHAPALRPRWHLIGHLQRNKARRAVRLADVVHSIDGERLLEAVDRVAGEEGRAPELYLQVKLADEPTKSGLAPDEVAPLVERAELAHARLVGLMTIAPLPAEDTPRAERLSAAEAVFEELARLADTLPEAAFGGRRPRLSMGMSDDLEAAVRAGADVVRVGSALFEGVDVPALDTPELRG